MTSALRRFASRAPVRLYAIAGVGARDELQDLQLDPLLRFEQTPRAANILLVAGHIRHELVDAVVSAHEAVSHPRAVVLWNTGGDDADLTEALPSVITAGVDPVETLVRVHADLVTGVRATSAAVRPDVDPVPWRGVGPYGQGGSGMTGGVPYGRPLAERAPDRDGLTLDQLSFRVGPYWHPFPPGLLVEIDLQGDVIQRITLPAEAFVPSRSLKSGDIFVRALTERVPVAEMEIARARGHLRRLAEAAALHGLDALGRRILRLAGTAGPCDAEDAASLAGPLRRSGFLGWATSGVGSVKRDAVTGMGLGPTARAAGVPEDVRSHDAVYRALGFEPILDSAGDVGARWRVRFAEAVQSLRLSERAGDHVAEPTGRVESPRGRLEHGSAPTARLMDSLPSLLEGLEWGDAVATIVSLDLDLDELRAHSPSYQEGPVP